MKTKILALAGILLAVAAFTFVFPVTTARASMETTACPSTICIINGAGRSSEGPQALDLTSCSAKTHGCAYCCGYCSNFDDIVGKAYPCGCVGDVGFDWCPW